MDAVLKSIEPYMCNKLAYGFHFSEKHRNLFLVRDAAYIFVLYSNLVLDLSHIVENGYIIMIILGTTMRYSEISRGLNVVVWSGLWCLPEQISEVGDYCYFNGNPE